MVYESLGSTDTSWAGMTYSEIKDLGGKDGSIVIVPVASIEQHGDHLPVATDTILADAAAHLGASRVRDELPVVVTPPIWSGLSSHHMPFGGTLTLDFENMLHLVENVGSSALENGFDAILLLNGHGGNMALISAAINAIGSEHPGVEVLGLSYFYLLASYIEELRDSDVGGMMHGGEMETSLMLHLRPDLVNDTALEANYTDRKYDLLLDDLYGSGPLGIYSTFADHSETGVIGDPEVASAEKGAAMYDALGDEMEELLVAVHKRIRSAE